MATIWGLIARGDACEVRLERFCWPLIGAKSGRFMGHNAPLRSCPEDWRAGHRMVVGRGLLAWPRHKLPLRSFRPRQLPLRLAN
jgi:hypothetical protein